MSLANWKRKETDEEQITGGLRKLKKSKGCAGPTTLGADGRSYISDFSDNTGSKPSAKSTMYTGGGYFGS